MGASDDRVEWAGAAEGRLGYIGSWRSGSLPVATSSSWYPAAMIRKALSHCRQSLGDSSLMASDCSVVIFTCFYLDNS